LEALKQESEMSLDDLLNSLPAEMFDKAAADNNDSSADQQVPGVFTYCRSLFCSLCILNTRCVKTALFGWSVGI